jgi:hypothetical protein
MSYKDFIPQNVAPLGTRRIGIYDSNGNRVGFIPPGSLTAPNAAKKLYSFGALSDVHLPYTTGESDFKNALNYFVDEEKVDLVCISGDLCDTGTEARLAKFQEMVQTYSPNIPVYVSAGNHDAYNTDGSALREESVVSNLMQTYTGKPLYFSFEHKSDVFIFVGICKDTFSVAELQWLYEELEKYRNRRCFLFQHAFNFDGSGNAFGLYTYNLLSGTRGNVFLDLLSHYHNVVWFHGHSHTKFHGQEFNAMANIDKVLGCWSVHIPSVAIPRTDADGDFDFQIEYQDSEGYVVDVYENGIHLRGRDFVKGEFLPIASYWLDTPLQTVPAGAYKDSTGTITT